MLIYIHAILDHVCRRCAHLTVDNARQDDGRELDVNPAHLVQMPARYHC